MPILLAQVYFMVRQLTAEMLLQQIGEYRQEASLSVCMPA